MPRCRRRGLNSGVIVFALAGLSSPQAFAAADWFPPTCAESSAPTTSTPQLELVLVRTSPRQTGQSETVLHTRDGTVWVTLPLLLQWDVPVPRRVAMQDGERYLPLTDIAGLHYRLDTCTQELLVDLAGARRSASFDLSKIAASTEGLVPVEPGAYLNLDAQVTYAPDSTRGSAFGELGFFNATGYGAMSFIADTDNSVRLDTSWTIDDTQNVQRFTFGDAITRGATFGQSLRVGGVQWGRQFALQPDLITYPLPSFAGSAALASSVDVYINQTLQASQPVPAGPFQLNHVPVIVGQGEVQLVVRDLLGREQILNYPFYAAPTLLREGLDDYSVSAGWLRDGFGQTSFDYGAWLITGAYRRGLSDQLTVEAYGETLREQQLLSTSLAFLQDSLGVFSAGVAASGSADGAGVSGQLGFERVSRGWSFATELRRASRGFKRAGEIRQALRGSELVRVGFMPHPSGSVSLSYLRQRRDDTLPVSIVGLTYAYSFSREWNVFASVNRVSSDTVSASVLVGLNWQFGANLLATLEGQRDGNQNRGRLSVQRTPQNALDFGWRASMERGTNERYDAQAQWGTSRGTLTGSVERLDDNHGARVSYATGLALLGSDVFWTRPIVNSFAVVEAPAISNVRIYSDERLAGRTDQNGLLLVPDVRTYEPTRLRVEDADIPIEYELNTLSRPVLLKSRGGARVPIQMESHAGDRVLELRQVHGEPVPAGARWWRGDTQQDLPVGFGGQILLAGNVPAAALRAQWPGGRCSASADAVQSATNHVMCQPESNP